MDSSQHFIVPLAASSERTLRVPLSTRDMNQDKETKHGREA